MRRALLLLLTISCLPLTGCDTLQKKHDSPVMVAAPRRVAQLDPSETDVEVADANDGRVIPKDDDDTSVEQVRATMPRKNPWDGWKDDTAIFNSQVAATVNGAPILNGDILDPFSGYLLSARQELQKVAADPKLLKPGMPEPTPEFYDQVRYQLIQANIATHVRNRILVERLKAGMKPEQIKALNQHIDDEFAKRTVELRKELGVSKKTEME